MAVILFSVCDWVGGVWRQGEERVEDKERVSGRRHSTCLRWTYAFTALMSCPWGGGGGVGCYKKCSSRSCCRSYPPWPCWQLLSLLSLPHAQIFCLFSLCGKDLLHPPSKHVPIFLLTFWGGGADSKLVQNAVVDVWLPQGAGGELGWDGLLTRPVVFMELAGFPPLHCALIGGLNGGSLGIRDRPGSEPCCCGRAFHPEKVLCLLPASVPLPLCKGCDSPHAVLCEGWGEKVNAILGGWLGCLLHVLEQSIAVGLNRRCFSSRKDALDTQPLCVQRH